MSVFNVLPREPVSPAAGFGLALCIAALAALLHWAIQPWVGSHVPFLFFLPALMFSAVTLGRGPASLVLLAGGLNAALMSPPVGSFAMDRPHDVAALAVYAAIGVLLVFYGGRMRITTMQAALAERRLALAQENTRMGVFELDFFAGTAYVSPSLCQILQQPTMQGPMDLDRWLGQLNPGQVEESKRAIAAHAARGELSYEREQRIDMPDGAVLWLLHRVRLETDSAGRLTQARGATVDITARKQIDAILQSTQAELQQQLLEQERADRRKDEFLATLAHELRNPLAPIRQSVRIARSPHATERQRAWSHDVIERQVQSMSLLLDDLLDVSRIGRGALLLRKSRESLAAVVETAVETARPNLEAKGHRLDVSLPADAVLLYVDPLRIAQVLGNLLTNAAKYTDPGGRIRLAAESNADGLLIRITDNGIGLTAEQMEHIFELFAQLPAARERSEGGLGIGLALVRGLVELHGGSVEAASAGPGAGTEVTVRLPASCLSPIERHPVASAPGPPEKSDGWMQRILIADDNHDSANSLAELLRLEGHEVHVAYDGEQALDIFRSVQPDAALLDIGMPHLSGLEVVKAIRGQSSGHSATLIAVTGWGQEDDRREALASGFDHHLTKPIQPEQLHALLGGQ